MWNNTNIRCFVYDICNLLLLDVDFTFILKLDFSKKNKPGSSLSICRTHSSNFKGICRTKEESYDSSICRTKANHRNQAFILIIGIIIIKNRPYCKTDRTY